MNGETMQHMSRRKVNRICVGRERHLETFINFVSLLSGSTSTRQSASLHAVLITDD